MAEKESGNNRRIERILLAFAIAGFLLVAADFSVNLSETVEARSRRMAVVAVDPINTTEIEEGLSQEELNRIINERFKGEIRGN